MFPCKEATCVYETPRNATLGRLFRSARAEWGQETFTHFIWLQITYALQKLLVKPVTGSYLRTRCSHHTRALLGCLVRRCPALCHMHHAGTVAMASAPFVLISSRANSSNSSCQMQAGSATLVVLLLGVVCWWHAGEKPGDSMAVVGMWQVPCTPHHSTLTVCRGAEAKASPARTHPRPALPTHVTFPSVKIMLPPCPHPLLVSLRSMDTGWKSEGRKEPEMEGSIACSQYLCREMMVHCLYPTYFSSSETSLLQAIKGHTSIKSCPPGKAAREKLRNTLSPTCSFHLLALKSLSQALLIFPCTIIYKTPLILFCIIPKWPSYPHPTLSSLEVNILRCFHSGTGELEKPEIRQEWNSCSHHHEYYGFTHKNSC